MSQQEVENRKVLIEGGLTRFYIEWGMSGKSGDVLRLWKNQGAG